MSPLRTSHVVTLFALFTGVAACISVDAPRPSSPPPVDASTNSCTNAGFTCRAPFLFTLTEDGCGADEVRDDTFDCTTEGNGFCCRPRRRSVDDSDAGDAGDDA